MAAIKKKLLDRVIKRFPWVSQDAEIVRCYPSLGERQAGAFLWLVIGYDIGSHSTMTQCVEAESWEVFETEHHFEIFPKNELVE
jgi:hypothetical protein